MTSPSPYRSAEDRARDTAAAQARTGKYDAAMGIARQNRQARAAVAASAAVGLARQLAQAEARDAPNEETSWSVRGEPRTRATFGHPHPGDFTGGLPLPGETPVIPR